MAARLAEDLAALPPSPRDLLDPHPPPLHVSDALRGLSRRARSSERRHAAAAADDA